MSAQHQAPLPLLIPRPLPQAEAFADTLLARMPGRWAPVIAPLMRIAPLGAAIDAVPGTPLLFSSRNAVAAATPLLDPSAHRALCVGSATTAAANDAGFDAREGGPDAATLIENLQRDSRDSAASWLHLRGVHTTGNLAASLRAIGVSARDAVIYDQRPVPLPEPVTQDLRSGRIAAVTLFSRRSALLLLQAVPDLSAEVALMCLSPAVAEAIPADRSNPVHVAPYPDADGMRTLLGR